MNLFKDTEYIKTRLQDLDDSINWKQLAEALDINYQSLRRYVRGEGKKRSNYILIHYGAEKMYNSKAIA